MQPETPAGKQFEFTGSAGSFFINYLVSNLLSIIPFVGFALGFNYQASWFAANAKVNGKKLAYKAGFGEVWVLLFVGILLTVLTLGIYFFWFAPKVCRFVADHLTIANEAAPASPAPAAVTETEPTPIAVSDVTPPAAPTPPAGLVQ